MDGSRKKERVHKKERVLMLNIVGPKKYVTMFAVPENTTFSTILYHYCKCTGVEFRAARIAVYGYYVNDWLTPYIFGMKDDDILEVELD